MLQRALDFIKNNTSMVLTTHDTPDADGIGAGITLAYILRKLGKEARIINASPIPNQFVFMDPRGISEMWDPEKHQGLPEESALILLDVSDEFHTGAMKDIIPRFTAVLVIDHHELSPHAALEGFIDPSASSTCEMILEIAGALEISLDQETAVSAYAGISYDTGSFAYSKTTARTFKAALSLVQAGVKPYEIYGKLYESASTNSLLLQKLVLSTLEIHFQGRVAVQILKKEYLVSTEATFEDAEHFINTPLKSRDVLVSIMIKESDDGRVRCSLRSKGKVNVSRIAQQFSGGGHALAAGFRSNVSIDETLDLILDKVKAALNASDRLSAEKI
jgi:phosphoesterase RecJ-like protein